MTASARRRRLRLPELETLLPLLAAYVVLVALYAWQAWQRQTPTLFSDEIEFTQISRSIAETGRAALRGGEPAPGASLYAYLAAPAWWIDRVETAYEAVKLLGVLLMTAALFPAYALARLVVTRPYALFAAVATAAAPALSYSPFLVDEPLAYPVVDARALPDRPRRDRADALVGRARGAGVSRRSARPLAARGAPARAGARPPRNRLARRTAAALAVDLERGRLARRGGARGRRRGRPLGDARPPLEHLVRLDRLLQGPDARVRALGGRRPGDRDRRPAADRRARRARAAAGGGAGRRPGHVRRPHPRGDRLVRPLHRGQGRIHLDHAGDRRRGAKLDLPLPASLHRDGSSPRPAPGLAGGARRGDGVRALPRLDDAVHPRPVPELRGPRARDRGLREPSPALARRHDRDDARAAHARVGARARPAALRASAAARGRGGLRRGGVRRRLEPDDRDLRRERRARGLRPGLRQPAEAAGLGRPDHAWRADDLRRPGNRRPRRLAGRVLEPERALVLGHGRQRSGPGRAADAEPDQARRHSGSGRPERGLRARRQRRPDRRTGGDHSRGRGALQARRQARSADADDDRDLTGRLDGEGGDVHPLRRARTTVPASSRCASPARHGAATRTSRPAPR